MPLRSGRFPLILALLVAAGIALSACGSNDPPEVPRSIVITAPPIPVGTLVAGCSTSELEAWLEVAASLTNRFSIESLAALDQPPETVPDTLSPVPQSSYGAQKAMGELMVNDFSRKGYIDGRILRMPTISVRPGAPNKAASSFASGIIREPLNGQEAVCPVDGDTRMWLMSPRQAIRNLIHGHELDAGRFEASRILSLPGLSVTVREMADALTDVAGGEVAQRIQWREDEAVKRIVNSWPGNFEATRAKALGFTSDTNFSDIIRAYLQDDKTP